jgi:hypothetical protein
MKPTQNISYLPSLNLIAHRLQIVRASEAAGRCLTASLDFAVQAATHHGIEVQLVKWRVVGDPHYVDHWAVLRDDQSVFDLTRIQVDKSRQLVCKLDSYPANYTDRRIYPAALVLGDYLAAGKPHEARLSTAFIWTCGTKLLRFDLEQAWRRRELHFAQTTLQEAGTFIKCFLMGCFTRWLEDRSQQLLARLHAQPNVSARSMHKLPPWVPAPSALNLQAKTQQVLCNASTLGLAANAHWYNLCTVAIGCL